MYASLIQYVPALKCVSSQEVYCESFITSQSPGVFSEWHLKLSKGMFVLHTLACCPYSYVAVCRQEGGGVIATPRGWSLSTIAQMVWE